MIPKKINLPPDVLFREGLIALREAMGVVGMSKFSRIYNKGQGDYTKDRREDNRTIEEITEEINARKKYLETKFGSKYDALENNESESAVSVISYHVKKRNAQ